MTRFKGLAAASVASIALAAVDGGPSWAQPDPDTGAEPDQASSYSWEIPAQPTRLQRKLQFQVIGREQGLPQNGVSSIVQDNVGFVWLGTQDGVARYDGQRFVVFRNMPDDDTTISNSFINDLLVSGNGTLWIATEGGGVNRYKPETNTFDRFIGDPSTVETLNSGSILSMTEGSDGRIWVGTGDAGIAVIDPADGSIASYTTDVGVMPTVPAIQATQDGRIWVGTTTGGLLEFDPKAKKATPVDPTNEILSNAIITELIVDSKGNLWVGTASSGLIRFDPKTKNTLLYQAAGDPADDRPDMLSDNSVQALLEDSAGRIWVGTQKGVLHILDPATGKFERHATSSGDSKALPDAPVDVFEDAAGVMWVGTFGGGAALVDSRALKIRGYQTLSSVSALFMKGKDLWVTTFDGVCRFAGTSAIEGECYPIPQATPVIVDRKDTVWVGTLNDGLFRHDKNAGAKWISYAHNPNDNNSLPQGVVVRLHEDRAGQLWVALLGGGLRRFDPKTEEFVEDYEGLPSNMIYMVREDPKLDGVLWLGTGDAGLISLNVATGETEQFLPKKDDPENKTDNSVVDFLFDGDDTIWLATYGGGLKRMNRKTKDARSYGRAEGMPSATIYSIRKEESGKLWLSTISGLVRFDPESEVVHVFTPADGVLSEEFTLTAAEQAEDGHLAFGGSNGFNLFNPEDIDIDKYRAPVVLTSVEVLGDVYKTRTPLRALDSIKLAHDEGFITVEFAALSYAGADRLQFEYKIEGASDRWLKSEAATVSLAGLDDGDYTLLMRARNRHGVDSEPLKLAIIITPPPWRTWWAYTGYGLTFLGLLFGIYRYQQVRIERLEKLARLATVEKEFEVTAAVQAWFLPRSDVFRSNNYDLVGFYRAANQCSGDWWWYEDLGNGKLWVIVADVTGHGAGPAMVTAAVAMGLGVQSGPNEVVQEQDLLDRLTKVNAEVLFRCEGKAHMTMTACLIDTDTGEATIYGLGGLPALVSSQDGRNRSYGARGTPLGSTDLQIGVKSMVMQPGDRLLLMTDGLVEAMLPNGRQLGMRRFSKIMTETAPYPLGQAVPGIVQRVDVERGAELQDDDFTVCVVERRA